MFKVSECIHCPTSTIATQPENPISYKEYRESIKERKMHVVQIIPTPYDKKRPTKTLHKKPKNGKNIINKYIKTFDF